MLYHYTVQRYVDSILSDGFIRLATANLMPGERGVVWLTTSDQWDETCNKGYDGTGYGDGGSRQLSRDLTHRRGGLSRLCLPDDIATATWVDFKQQSGIKGKLARQLYNSAVRVGSKPSDWRVSFDPIPANEVIRVEFWDGVKWGLDRPPIEQPDVAEILKMSEPEQPGR